MLIFNEDPDSRFYRVEAGTMRPEKMDLIVDNLTGSQVKVLLVCTNAMKANFPSRVLQPFTDGFDANLGMDQPCMNGEISDWGYRRAANIQVLEKHGIDSNEYLLNRAEKAGFTTGITVRMNDAHGLWLKRSLLMSDFYLEHPEFRIRKMYPMEPLDFRHAGVRDRMVRFCREVLEKYDVSILVTDWMRHPPFFDVGAGEESLPILTGMMEEIRAVTEEISRKRGRKIELWADVPSSHRFCRNYGIDAAEWADRKIVDRLILASKYMRDQTISVREFRMSLKDPAFPVSMRMENAFQPYPDDEMYHLSLDELKRTDENGIRLARGDAWSAFCRGTEDIELFNYMGARNTPAENCLFRECGRMETLKGLERWTVLSYNDLDMDEWTFFKGWREPGYFRQWIEEKLKKNEYPYQLPRLIRPGTEEIFSFPCGRIPEENAVIGVCFAGVPAEAELTLKGIRGEFDGHQWNFRNAVLTEDEAAVAVRNPGKETWKAMEAVLKVCFPKE